MNGSADWQDCDFIGTKSSRRSLDESSVLEILV
jgi:hypothetical protein